MSTNLNYDDTDLGILENRLAAWNKRKGPRVGDWCLMLDGTERRFAHDWGDSLQVNCPNFGGPGSFYLGEGYVSYSGSLDPSIPKTELLDTGELRNGSCWFFRHDFWRAHNGVDFVVLCRVFRQVAAKN